MRIDILTGISLNGFIAEKNESSLNLIDEFNETEKILEYQFKIRNNYDAIMVGTNTVLIDNPRLNSHKNVLSKRDLHRITIDSNGKIPFSFNFLDGTEKTFIGVSQKTPKKYISYLQSKNIKYHISNSDPIDLNSFFKYLNNQNINSILVEGGGTLISSLLKGNMINNLTAIQMPIVLNSNSVNFTQSFQGRKNLKLIKTSVVGEFVVIEYKVLNK